MVGEIRNPVPTATLPSHMSTLILITPDFTLATMAWNDGVAGAGAGRGRAGEAAARGSAEWVLLRPSTTPAAMPAPRMRAPTTRAASHTRRRRGGPCGAAVSPGGADPPPRPPGAG